MVGTNSACSLLIFTLFLFLYCYFDHHRRLCHFASNDNFFPRLSEIALSSLSCPVPPADKLLELFQDFNAQASHESLGTVDCILKIFCNLLDLEFFKDESRAAALHGRVQQLAANLSEALPAMPSLRGLADLTQSALQAIADQWPQLQSVDELEELLQPPGQA